jgi:hypothetical protein
MELAGEFPVVVIGCVDGGSNFAGLAFPFVREKIAGREIDVLAYMAAYDNYFAVKLEDVALDEDEMRRAFHGIEGLLLDARSTASTGAWPSHSAWR